MPNVIVLQEWGMSQKQDILQREKNASSTVSILKMINYCLKSYWPFQSSSYEDQLLIDEMLSLSCLFTFLLNNCNDLSSQNLCGKGQCHKLIPECLGDPLLILVGKQPCYNVVTDPYVFTSFLLFAMLDKIERLFCKILQCVLHL